MENKDVLDYVTNTPGNTNRRVLDGMLNQLNNGTGGWPEDLPLPSQGGYGYTDADETAHKIDSKYLPAKELPVYPEEDGTYTLSLTITDGVAALEWKSSEI